MPETLPIHAILDELIEAFNHTDEVVLQAPPGAGKTTYVPWKFLGTKALGDGKLLMLEPRRIAARNAAARMATLLGESVGETVGYRMRLDTRVGPTTKIEIVTEGVLIRMLQDDPALGDYSIIIFDEFHERSLDADLGLALVLKSRELFRDEPLKVLLMSATLEENRLSLLLGGAPVITSEGRTWPTEIKYLGAGQPRDRIVNRMHTAITRVVKEHPKSSILAFLPGEGEIRQLASLLKTIAPDPFVSSLKDSIEVVPLYGNLSLEAQRLAILPVAVPKIKIVLATNIAESSLTIDGVDVVVDSGLERQARFDPGTAMTRLQTVRISQASATQRAGRAGRLGPGVCYRLWSAEQQSQMAAQTSPEILLADLAPMALQILNWGIDNPTDLSWLDSPPNSAWQQGLDQLKSLGAIRKAEQPKASVMLTGHGADMAMLSLPPRISHMLIEAKRIGAVDVGCALAAFLADRDPFARDETFGVAIDLRLDILLGHAPCPAPARGWLQRSKQLLKQYQTQVSRIEIAPIQQNLNSAEQLACLVAFAFPDRIARRRHAGGFQLANGRSASMLGKDSLDHEKWLVVAEVTGRKGNSDIIRSATKFLPGLLDKTLASLQTTHTHIDWDKKSSRFIAEQQTLIGQLVLNRQSLPDISDEARTDAICRYISEQGLALFKRHSDLLTLERRCRILFDRFHDPIYDLGEATLLGNIDEWLAPNLGKATKLEAIVKLNITQFLLKRMTYEQKTQLDLMAPETFEVPTGSKIRINYAEQPPVLPVKLQEMFGCTETPTIGDGQVPLQVHLLSPAGRPLQVTQDLAGFWRTSYFDVRKEMRGRYPKHPWPEDPTATPPTRYTKARKRN